MMEAIGTVMLDGRCCRSHGKILAKISNPLMIVSRDRLTDAFLILCGIYIDGLEFYGIIEFNYSKE